jgi:hypothetical protein
MDFLLGRAALTGDYHMDFVLGLFLLFCVGALLMLFVSGKS